MNQPNRLNHSIAPCIVDTGIIVNKDDMQRLLNDLCHVCYRHSIDNRIDSEGEGFIQEIFSDAYQSTLIANGNLYINLKSFDYLQLSKSLDNRACFDLIQDNRQLRLIPISNNTLNREQNEGINAAAIEAMVTEVLSARLDVQLDDEEF